MKIRKYSAGFSVSLLLLAVSAVFAFLVSSEKSRAVSVERCRKLGLPVLSVQTDKNEAIKRKDKYLKSSYEIENFSGRCKIRGHGNSTWKTAFTQKRPYLLKLDESRPLLGMNSAQKWILLANASDRSMLRNFYAEYLSRNVWNKMKWNPSSKFITLFVNGKYMGLYSLTEKIDVAEGRVEFSGEGFLAEIDSHSGRPYDFTGNYGLNFHIRQPKTTEENYKRYAQKILELEKILYSPRWKDEDGYKKHFDVDSFVDWYLLSEFSKNYDAKFYNSVFMNYDFGTEKLYMGPVWDHDIAFGNTSKSSTNGFQGTSELFGETFLGRFYYLFDKEGNSTAAKDSDGFLINQSHWFYRLFCDEEFARKVAARYNETRPLLEKSILWLREQGENLDEAATLNDSVWHILGSAIWPRASGYRQRKTYKSEVNFLVDWCESRLEFFDFAFVR